MKPWELGESNPYMYMASPAEETLPPPPPEEETNPYMKAMPTEVRQEESPIPPVMQGRVTRQDVALPAPEEESWATTLYKSAMGGFASIPVGLTGAGKAAYEAFGGKDTGDIDDAVEIITNYWRPKVGDNLAKKYASEIVQSITGSAPMMATGPLALPLFGLTAGGGKYQQMREAGKGIEESIAAAIPVGLSEALTEKLPLDVLRKAGTPIIRRFLLHAGLEIPGELINTLVEGIVDKVMLKKPMTLREFIDTAIVTTGQSLVLSGGKHITEKAPPLPTWKDIRGQMEEMREYPERGSVELPILSKPITPATLEENPYLQPAGPPRSKPYTKEYTPKWFIQEYLQNMYDSGEADYPELASGTAKEIWNRAVDGARYWVLSGQHQRGSEFNSLLMGRYSLEEENIANKISSLKDKPDKKLLKYFGVKESVPPAKKEIIPPPEKPVEGITKVPTERKFDIPDDIDESIQGYMSERGEKGRENWIYNNNAKGLTEYAKEALSDDSYQDVVQQNLKRGGFPSIFTVYKGHPKGKNPFEKEFFNASVDKGLAENYRKALGVSKENWEVSEVSINLSDVIGVGHPEEGELIIRKPTGITKVPLTPETLEKYPFLGPSTKPPKELSPNWKDNVIEEPPKLNANKVYTGTPTPMKIDTPEKLEAFRSTVEPLIDEGLPGRYFYRNDASAILDHFNGDVDKAKKAYKLAAVLSWQTPVRENIESLGALWKGELEGKRYRVGKTGLQKRRAKQVWREEELETLGRKSDAFAGAMEYYLDPQAYLTRMKGKFPIPVDTWMARIYGFTTDKPLSPQQYAFIENDILRLAKKRDMNPLEVQAAMWLSGMGRWELSKGPLRDRIRDMGLDPFEGEGLKYFEDNIHSEMMKIPREEVTKWVGEHVHSFSSFMENIPFFQKMVVLHYGSGRERLRGATVPSETKRYSQEIRNRMEAGDAFPEDPRLRYRPEISTYQSGTIEREPKVTIGQMQHAVTIPEHLIYDLNRDWLKFRDKARLALDEKGQIGNWPAERNFIANAVHDKGYLGYGVGVPGKDRQIFLFGDWKTSMAKDYYGGVSQYVQGVTPAAKSFDEITTRDTESEELLDHAHSVISQYYPELNLSTQSATMYQGGESNAAIERSLEFGVNGPIESVRTFLVHLGLSRGQNSIFLEEASPAAPPTGMKVTFKVKGSPEELRNKGLTLGLEGVNIKQREDGTYVSHFLYTGDIESAKAAALELEKFHDLYETNGEGGFEYVNSSSALVGKEQYEKVFKSYFGERGSKIHEKVRREGEAFVKSKRKRFQNPPEQVGRTQEEGESRIPRRASGGPVRSTSESPEVSRRKASEAKKVSKTRSTIIMPWGTM